MLLRVENLHKTYQTKDTCCEAVQNMTFALRKGERLGIVGLSGCGKSTLLRMLAMFEEPTSGTILFNEESLVHRRKKDKYKIYEQLQMVFQNPNSIMSPRMTIGRFLEEPLINFKSSEKQTLSIDEALYEVELPLSIKAKYPNEVSGGQLQRIALARALLINPQLILLDEPTSALDVTTQQTILELITKLWIHHHFAYIMVGHDMAVVRQMTDRILVIKGGSIVEEIGGAQSLESVREPYTKALIKASLLGLCE